MQEAPVPSHPVEGVVGGIAACEEDTIMMECFNDSGINNKSFTDNHDKF